ncbi:hypothetical protein PHMEG_00031417 [Phytophthora megakarya]|uniref:Uncharacterized protein n=1 Tax=Phytophthora megakarya TaxID=4795 RepID=A0A225UZC2_9STRA|nr:hypothetical protein PHMEG_00031417 [Phytophthora megakarya]
MCETRAAPVVAIDVGTTNLRVGVWQNDRVEIIPNSQGAYSTPAYVAFTASECLVGEAAELQATRNAANTIFSVNRLIGRKFSDGKLQEDRS